MFEVLDWVVAMAEDGLDGIHTAVQLD